MIVVGAAVPVLILVVFFGYLYVNHAESVFEARMIGLRRQADYLERTGRSRAAFDKYEELLSLIGRKWFSASRYHVIAANAEASRDRLHPLVKAELEREEQERLAEAEAERLAAAAKAEAERLSQLKADITGGAWAINGLGQSNILRGLHVYLVRARVSRKDADYHVSSAGNRANNMAAFPAKLCRDLYGDDEDTANWRLELRGRIKEDAKRLTSLPKIQPIDTAELYRLFRLVMSSEGSLEMAIHSALGYGSPSPDGLRGDVHERFAGFDSLWPDLLKSCVVEKVTTDIDGKFVFKNITGGKYYLYALHATRTSIMEWLKPVRSRSKISW